MRAAIASDGPQEVVGLEWRSVVELRQTTLDGGIVLPAGWFLVAEAGTVVGRSLGWAECGPVPCLPATLRSIRPP